MFEGYYFRRRLKTLLISIIGSLALIILIYRWQNVSLFNRSLNRFHLNRRHVSRKIPDKILLQPDSIPKPEALLPPLLEKQSISVLSLIEFSNSPYLELESESSNIIPIMILSNASNIEIRDAIRRTWGFDQLYRNDTIQVKIFFLVGTDDYMIQRIRAEQILFDDVIQVSIPDMYSFSAYKELSAMIWVRAHLSNAPFYIKTDDDVILNMKAIVDQLLPMIEDVAKQNLIIGWFGSEHSVQRHVYQKFVNAVIPPSTVDLNYAMNLLYAVTSNGADRMLDALSHVDIIEQPGDPFVTGILRDAAHVQINNLGSSSKTYRYQLADGKCKDAFQKDSKLLLCTSSLHAGNTRLVAEYFEAWNLLIS